MMQRIAYKIVSVHDVPELNVTIEGKRFQSRENELMRLDSKFNYATHNSYGMVYA